MNANHLQRAFRAEVDFLYDQYIHLPMRVMSGHLRRDRRVVGTRLGGIREFLLEVCNTFARLLEQQVNSSVGLIRGLVEPVKRDALRAVESLRREFRYHPVIQRSDLWQISRDYINGVYVSALSEPAA